MEMDRSRVRCDCVAINRHVDVAIGSSQILMVKLAQAFISRLFKRYELCFT